MTETTVGREPVQIVELVQPICMNTFGSAPCTATGTADEKCYNTRATCLDGTNFALGTSLSLYFSRGNVADVGVSDYIIPSLISVSTTPTKINLASSNPDSQGLGNRALVSLTFADHQHTDRIVDPYLSGRSWNPLDAERGTFWQRWMARNKYRQGIRINIYEGYDGQSLGSMTKRTYFATEFSGPDGNGRVSIKGKDILYKVEERKAQAPVASPGEVYTDIDDSVTSIEVAGAVEADYSASGTLRINDEIMTYTARATSSNGITFTGVTRGTDGTTAAAHEAEDKVQECLRFDNLPPHTGIRDLLRDYAGVSSSWIPYADWTTEVNTYVSAYKLNALISEPTSVLELVSQIQEQSLVYVWWDERDQEIKFRAIRGIDAEPDTLTDESHILADSLSLSEMPRERVSQVWIYYNLFDHIEDPDKPKAYKELYVLADLDSETDEKYGEPSVRKIYARFLSSGALAQNTASKINLRYVDVPSQVKFRMDAKDRAKWTGDIVKINHRLDRDKFGNRRVRQWLIVSAEEVVPGETVEYVAEDVTLYGQIYYVMAGASADYPGYDSAPFKNCYIGDASGLLSDGQSAGRIS